MAMPAGLRHAEALPEPIFTPSTKATEGHDLNIGKLREQSVEFLPLLKCLLPINCADVTSHPWIDFIIHGKVAWGAHQ
jgi:hypothetical protein